MKCIFIAFTQWDKQEVYANLSVPQKKSFLKEKLYWWLFAKCDERHKEIFPEINYFKSEKKDSF
jgi:hypothetical protein